MTEDPTFRRVIRIDLSEEATFKHRPEENEGVGYVDGGRKGVLRTGISTCQVPEKGVFSQEHQG